MRLARIISALLKSWLGRSLTLYAVLWLIGVITQSNSAIISQGYRIESICSASCFRRFQRHRDYRAQLSYWKLKLIDLKTQYLMQPWLARCELSCAGPTCCLHTTTIDLLHF